MSKVKRIGMEVKSPNERHGSLSSRKRKIIQLQKLLGSLIQIEEYELCIQLRDIINRMKDDTLC